MSLGREKEESFIEYQIRICSERERYGLTWDEVAHILNEETGENFGESKYRKWWYAFNEGLNYAEQIAAEKKEAVKEYIGEQKKDFQMLKSGEQASTIVAKLSEEELKDPDYLLKIHGYDSNNWEITSARQSIWNNKLDNELYSSKITVKPRVGFNWSEENIKKIFEKVASNVDFSKGYDVQLSKIENPDADEMLLIGVADLHFGLLAKNNLSENYNMQIAEDRFHQIISDVIRRKQDDSRVEKVVLLIGNDFLNADNLQGTTARHFTPQDQETNWYEMITKATEMLIREIDRLDFFFPLVEVINVKGNHDEMSMFGIMQTLNAYYKDSPSVFINTDSRFRQYLKYGVNLIGFSHNEKINDVAKIMAAESPDWSNSRYRAFILGHLHVRQLLEDDHGVDIRRLPSVTSASAWTASEGYCGTNKMSETFIFNKYKGLTGVINTIVE